MTLDCKEDTMKAIDVHAHLNTREMMEVSLGRYNEAMQKYYKFDLKTKMPEEMAIKEAERAIKELQKK